jgi:bifunctional non-homologous end joining protein LigD
MAARKPGLKAPYRGFVEPALVTSIEKVPSEERWWVHEIKLDGYRVRSTSGMPPVKVFTRRGNDWSNRFQRCRPTLGTSPSAPRS